MKKGFTLAETVVALFIFSLLSLCVLELLTRSEQNFRRAQQLHESVIQEKAAYLTGTGESVYTEGEWSVFVSGEIIQIPIFTLTREHSLNGFEFCLEPTSNKEIRIYAPVGISEIIIQIPENNVLEVTVIPSNEYEAKETDVLFIWFPKDYLIRDCVSKTSSDEIETAGTSALVLHLKSGMLHFSLSPYIQSKSDKNTGETVSLEECFGMQTNEGVRFLPSEDENGLFLRKEEL
jgi:prepilin-type N-terminal cleavage/methylation domain-containing protein